MTLTKTSFLFCTDFFFLGCFNSGVFPLHCSIVVFVDRAPTLPGLFFLLRSFQIEYQTKMICHCVVCWMDRKEKCHRNMSKHFKYFVMRCAIFRRINRSCVLALVEWIAICMEKKHTANTCTTSLFDTIRNFGEDWNSTSLNIFWPNQLIWKHSNLPLWLDAASFIDKG